MHPLKVTDNRVFVHLFILFFLRLSARASVKVETVTTTSPGSSWNINGVEGVRHHNLQKQKTEKKNKPASNLTK